jgi:hypothetical protein
LSIPGTDEDNAYEITTEITMDGVSESNFESLKNDLTVAVSKSLGVPLSSVKLEMSNSDTVSALSKDTVIVTIVSIKNETDMNTLTNSIDSGVFTEGMKEEISKTPALNTAGITLEAVSKSVVKACMPT